MKRGTSSPLARNLPGFERRARFPRWILLVWLYVAGLAFLIGGEITADQDAAFVMLERDGSVLATTGPVRPSDARLRRAQALAHSSGAALQIARELIGQKLAGQEQVARNNLLDTITAKTIAQFRAEVATADNISTIRLLESQGAAAYWAAWRTLPINFPRNDMPRVPEHWRTFGTRKSQLCGSPRLATSPPNAMLNYLYALLESETRLAVASLGLDPGLGFWHVDTPARDSLACDLMEPVRPKVDAFLLDWITREPLARQWFFEQRDGNCRLMAPFAVQLSETASTWGRAVAPFAEWVARTLWSWDSKLGKSLGPATRLTQRHKREAKGSLPLPPSIPIPRRENICRGCGKTIRGGRSHCANCAIIPATQRLVEAARIGRVTAQTPEARARQARSQRRHAEARLSWTPLSQPSWLTVEAYSAKIQPLLAAMSTSVIASAIGVCRWYAGRIRQGYRPHPRHWQALAQVVGVSPDLPNEQ